MQITIFGAGGKVGQQVVRLALAKNYQVVAFVHRHNPFTDARITIVSGNINDTRVVQQALESSDAVISTLGSWGTKHKNVLQTAMETIIPAMQQQKITRIITLTGAGAYAEDDEWSTLDRINHQLLNLVAPKILKDSEAHLQLLAASQLNWTSLRSPIMGGAESNQYRLKLTPARPWSVIARKAVAQAVFDQLTDTSFNRKAPVIHHV